MFAWICDGLDTPHPLGRQFDRYFQQQAAVESVRARTDQIAAAIAMRSMLTDGAGEPFRVASVGSGPAIDIEHAAKLLNESQRRRLAVTLLDLDAEALEHARGRLAGWLHAEQLTLVRDNLYRLADKPGAAAPLRRPARSAGFFDYLADEPAKRLLGLFWRHLCRGGCCWSAICAPLSHACLHGVDRQLVPDLPHGRRPGAVGRVSRHPRIVREHPPNGWESICFCVPLRIAQERNRTLEVHATGLPGGC